MGTDCNDDSSVSDVNNRGAMAIRIQERCSDGLLLAIWQCQQSRYEGSMPVNTRRDEFNGFVDSKEVPG
eukprot:9190754-Heterocapsa_arctica.AAC.1